MVLLQISGPNIVRSHKDDGALERCEDVTSNNYQNAFDWTVERAKIQYPSVVMFPGSEIEITQRYNQKNY
jgi:hypothetical protein